jgi:hypothetical protein
MISVEGFSGFVQELYDRTEDERLWEFFLHKVRDQSFEEFKGTLNGKPKDSFEMTKTQIETTINNSFDIMQGFIPDDL